MRKLVLSLVLALLASCACGGYPEARQEPVHRPEQGIIFMPKPQKVSFERTSEEKPDEVEAAEAEASFWKHVALFLGLAAVLAN